MDENIWSDFSAALTQIYNSKQLPQKRRLELYKKCANLCIVDMGDGELAEGNAFAADLYKRLGNFLTSRAQNCYEQIIENFFSQGALLQEYTKQWKAYKHSSWVANGIFAQLNRKLQLEEGHDYTEEIYNLALNIWKAEVFAKLSRLITHTILLDQIAEAGEKGRPNGTVIKAVADSYVDLGVYTIYALITEDHTEQDGENAEKYQPFRERFFRLLIEEADKRLKKPMVKRG